LLEAEQERKLGIRLNAALAALLRELMRLVCGVSLQCVTRPNVGIVHQTTGYLLLRLF